VPGTDDRIALYVKEGVGIRSTARIMKISPTTVIGRIKKIAAAIKPLPLKEGRHYEMDELCTYAGNKADRTYVAYALDRKSREVAGLVVGRRTKSNLRKVLDRVVGANAKRITTDGLDLYRYLVPPEIHRVKGFGINRIERHNLTLRTQLKRLTRRTLCYTKSVAMLHACVAIACWGGKTGSGVTCRTGVDGPVQ
jgi:insertion element IS1 protein InsB